MQASYSIGDAIALNHGQHRMSDSFHKGNAIATKIKVAAAGGIGFDQYGHLLLINRTASTLDVYAPGSSKPLHKLALPGSPIYFRMGRTERCCTLRTLRRRRTQ